MTSNSGSVSQWAGRRTLTRQLSPGHSRIPFETATVTAADTSAKTVTVSFGEGTDAVTLPYLAHYTPATGDQVLIHWLPGSSAVVIGAFA